MNKYTYKLLGDLEVTIRVTHNPFQLPLESLFQMAARKNKKRGFLFVSKILGKHLPVDPAVSLLGGAALAVLYQEQQGGSIPDEYAGIMEALRYPERAKDVYGAVKKNLLPLDEAALFIAFAETATALGHGMYDVFSGPARFLHTTREMLHEVEPTLCFEEEHSHATAHRCYSHQPDFFAGTDPVVLVDDEITTGKTALNIIRDLHQKHPRQRYVIASLLDWRSEEDRKRFADVERELGIVIHCLSLIAGQIEVQGTPIVEGVAAAAASSEREAVFRFHKVGSFFSHVHVVSTNSEGVMNPCPYLLSTGRFGLHHPESKQLDSGVGQCAAYLRGLRSGGRTLCMGSGEFMYIPMRVAAAMGEEIAYQSSTRSPIHPHEADSYAIRNVFAFSSPDDVQVPNFFYNIPEGYYEEIFYFMEREVAEEQLATLMTALAQTGIPNIHVVYFNG